MRYRRALNEALAEELERDPAVVLLGEDLGDPWGGTYKVTLGLSEAFGKERVRNTPISEGGIVGAGLGCAIGGLRPVVELQYMDFSLLAADQIINQVAKARYMTGGQLSAPIVIRGPGGGYRRSAAQHGQSLEGLFTQVPGLLVAAPATPADAKGLLKTAIRLDDPVIFFEHKELYDFAGDVPEGDHLVPFGRARAVRSGDDVTVVGWSKAIHLALDAAEELDRDHGISADIIDLRTLVPLDLEPVLESIGRTGALVVVQEAPRRGGFAAEIIGRVCDELGGSGALPRVARVTGQNVPLPMAPNLEDSVLPHVQTLVACAIELLSENRIGPRNRPKQAI